MIKYCYLEQPESYRSIIDAVLPTEIKDLFPTVFDYFWDVAPIAAATTPTRSSKYEEEDDYDVYSRRLIKPLRLFVDGKEQVENLIGRVVVYDMNHDDGRDYSWWKFHQKGMIVWIAPGQCSVGLIFPDAAQPHIKGFYRLSLISTTSNVFWCEGAAELKPIKIVHSLKPALHKKLIHEFVTMQNGKASRRG